MDDRIPSASASWALSHDAFLHTDPLMDFNMWSSSKVLAPLLKPRPKIPEYREYFISMFVCVCKTIGTFSIDHHWPELQRRADESEQRRQRWLFIYFIFKLYYCSSKIEFVSWRLVHLQSPSPRRALLHFLCLFVWCFADGSRDYDFAGK